MATLFNLTAANPPFPPTLTIAPNDWTLAVKYSDPSLNSPYGLAIDAAGNVWVTNTSDNSATEVLGVAAPVAPLSTSLTNGTTGGRP